MAIQRVYSPGWGVGEKLTSAQQNALDINSTYGIDKRAGQSDVFASMLVATGAGRVVKTVQTGPDSSITFHVQDGNSIVRVPTLTAARTYTLGHTGATGGDRIFFYVEGTGATASGYAQVVNVQGTGLFRLGVTNTNSPNLTAEGDSAEFIFTGGTWKLMYGAGPGMRAVDFTTSTTWTCPPGVFEVLLIGYGGGGGGGQGGVPYVTSGWTDVPRGCGGGGGGGSQLRVLRVSVVPGRTYTITIGAGGAPDNDGFDTTFADSAVPSTFLAVFVGASRGFPGNIFTGPINYTGGVTGHFGAYALGGAGARMLFVTTGVSLSPSGPSSIPTGSPVGVPTASRVNFGHETIPMRGPHGPGCGGIGVTSNYSPVMMRHGYFSVEGYAGGTAGPHGRYIQGVLVTGGGGGGGGGGGPGGVGGGGGTGGDCITPGSAAGLAGQVGGFANPNTGGGGGGGGAAGYEALTPLGGAAGGGGGSGGSGKLTVVFVK